MQPASQIHRSFLIYGFEWVPVGQLLGRGGGKGERDRKKRGSGKKKGKGKNKERCINLKKTPLVEAAAVVWHGKTNRDS